MELSLDQLRMFLAVVDEKGFTAAGRKLGRVQSAVSQAIGTMEEQLGYPLFESPRRKAHLSANGAALVPRAREVLAEYGALIGQARSLGAGLESEVAVVFDSLFPVASVTQLSRDIAEQFSECRQRLGFETLSAVLREVRDGDYPLGLVGPGAGDDPTLVRIPVGTLRLQPVASPEHPLAQHDGTITQELARRQRQIVFSSRASTTSPDLAVLAHHTWRVADIHAKHGLIVAGLGWGNLPAPMVAEDIQRRRLVALDIEGWGPDEHTLALDAIHRRDEPLGPIGREVVAAMRRVCS